MPYVRRPTRHLWCSEHRPELTEQGPLVTGWVIRYIRMGFHAHGMQAYLVPCNVQPDLADDEIGVLGARPAVQQRMEDALIVYGHRDKGPAQQVGERLVRQRDGKKLLEANLVIASREELAPDRLAQLHAREQPAPIYAENGC
eukprot:1787921-Pyramimonas_sp.AAC.2